MTQCVRTEFLLLRQRRSLNKNASIGAADMQVAC